MPRATLRAFSECPTEDLLRALVDPDDVSLIASAGLRLGDLARPGLAGPAALLPLREETRRRLAAAFELGRRRMREAGEERVRLGGPAEAADFVGSTLRDETVEVFRAILLDARNRLLAWPEVSRGTLSSSLVHPREVFRPAIQAAACAVIVVHNHPSGDPDPSPEDEAVTGRLARAGALLGIPLLDHVIVGDGRSFSFRDHDHPALRAE